VDAEPVRRKRADWGGRGEAVVVSRQDRRHDAVRGLIGIVAAVAAGRQAVTPREDGRVGTPLVADGERPFGLRRQAITARRRANRLPFLEALFVRQRQTLLLAQPVAV